MASADDILQNVNQPVIDHLVSLIVSGHTRQAINELLKLEGHWITEEDAIAFVTTVKRAYGR
jgi:hypothetical protein